MFALALSALLASAPALVAGSTAPDFTVKDIDGNELKLSKLVEQGPVVLAFFPKARTGGCTKEMQSYRDRHAEIQKLSGRVLAVSTDDAATLKSWRDELKAPMTFVADPDGKLIEQYTSRMLVVGYASRATFTIGPNLKIVDVQKGNDAIETSGAIQACSLRSHADAGTK